MHLNNRVIFFTILMIISWVMPAYSQDLLLLEKNLNQLLFMNPDEGDIVKTVDLPGSDQFVYKAITSDHSNIYILQRMPGQITGTVLVYHDNTIDPIAIIEGEHPEWIDIEYIGNGRLLLLNGSQAGGKEGSCHLYLLNFSEQNFQSQGLVKLGRLEDPSEGNDETEVFRIAYLKNDYMEGIWCLETDGNPGVNDDNSYNVGSGEDIFFFAITNWEGTEGNAVVTGSNKTDIGAYGEYSRKSDVTDFALDSQGNILILEQDAAVRETSYFGYNRSDDLYRIYVQYAESSISFPSKSTDNNNEVRLAEWPYVNDTAIRSSQVHLMTVDTQSGYVFGLDKKPDTGVNGIISLNHSIESDLSPYTGTVDMILMPVDPISYSEISGGTLTQNTIWSGHIRVTGDIVVPENIRLDILPGTHIMFAALSDDQNSGDNTSRCELIAENGSQLIIQGTTENPIVLSSDIIPSAPGDWGGVNIHFEMASQSVSITNCVIQGAVNGLSINQSGGYATVNLTDVQFNHNSSNGLYVYVHHGSHLGLNIFSSQDSGNRLTHQGCQAISNGNHGIYAFVEHEQSVLDTNIQRVLFENNVKNGLQLYAKNQATINYMVKDNLGIGHNGSSNWDKGNGICLYDESNSQYNGTFQDNIVLFNQYGIHRYSYNNYSSQTSNTFFGNTATHNLINGLRYYQYYGTGGTLIFENNSVSLSNHHGIDIYRRYRHDDQVLTIKLTNNHSFENALNGIAISRYNTTSGMVKVEAQDNLCENNTNDGIFIQANQPSHIQNNQCLNNGGNGFCLDGTDFTLFNNTSQGNQSNGFWIKNANHELFWSNISTENATNGLMLDSVSNGYYIYNRINDNNADGINLHATSELFFYKNNVYDNYSVEGDVFYELRLRSSYSVDARYNYWGSDIEANSVIWDRMDSESIGFVNKSQLEFHLIPVPDSPRAFIVDPVADCQLRTHSVYQLFGIAVSETEPYSVHVWTSQDTNGSIISGNTSWSYEFTPTTSGMIQAFAQVLGSDAQPNTLSLTVADNIPTQQGRIVQNETWSSDQSPILMTGDLTIQSGARLTIMPGTTIQFAMSDRMLGGTYPSLPELIVDGGELIINGTADQPVILTSINTSSHSGFWGGITVKQDASVKQPLIIHHLKASNAMHGLTYELTDFSDSNQMTPIILDHVAFNGNTHTGLNIKMSGGSGSLSMNNITTSENGSHGISIRTDKGGIWKADLAEIVSTKNNGTGLQWDHVGAAKLTLNLASPLSNSQTTMNRFMNNAGAGVDITVEENYSQLTVTASAGLYSANTVSGFIMNNTHRTVINYIIQNNEFYGHLKSGDWDDGVGIGLYNYSDAFMNGRIENNIMNHNRIGIYRYTYSYNVDDRLNTVIINNHVADHTSTGIFYYMYYGRGGSLSMLNNTVENNQGHGIEIYRRYRNYDYTFDLQLAHNKCLSNKQKGIYIHRYNSTSGSIELNCTENICQNNGEAGIYAQTTGVSTIQNNISTHNSGTGVYASSSSEFWILKNTIHHNGTNGLHITTQPKVRCFLNDIAENGEDGIHLESVRESDILYNSITANTGDGLEINATDQINVNANNFTGNYAVDTSFEIRNISNFPVDARFNFLGNAGADPLLIWDRNDDLEIGLITFTPIQPQLIQMPEKPVALIKNPLTDDILNNSDQTISGIAISETFPFTVEISTDSGTNFYTATGNTHWTYNWQNPSEGYQTLMARVQGSDYTPDKAVVLIDPNLPTTSGVLVKDETWSGTYRDILITGDITVPAGITLTITSGTQVVFAQSDDQRSGSISTKPELIIDGGALILAGTQQNPITLTTDSNTPTQGMWGGIQVSHDETESGMVTINHSTIQYSTFGIRYSGTNRYQDIVLDHVNVLQTSQTGIFIQLTGGSAALNLTDINASNNGQRGIQLSISGDANWQAFFTNIQANDNGEHGLIVETVDNAIMSVSQTSIIENHPFVSAFINNGQHGAIYKTEDNVQLTLQAEAAHYSGNGQSGLIVYGYNNSQIDYSIKDNTCIGHYESRDWYYGNGICLYMYSKKFDGHLYNNISKNNQYGIRFYVHYMQPFNISIFSNWLSDNHKAGIYLYQYGGYAGNFECTNNTIKGTDDGHGIDIYRRYANRDQVFTVILANNQLMNHQKNAINVSHYNSSSGKTVLDIHDNQCTGNSGYGINLNTIFSARIYANVIRQNVGTGISVHATDSSDILFNTLDENTQNDIIMNCGDISRIHYNNIQPVSDDIHYAINNKSSFNIDARYNYFDTEMPIDQIIFDKKDDDTKGIVNHENIYDAAVDTDFNNARIQITDPVEDALQIIPISPFTIRGIAVCRTGIKQVEIQVQSGGEWFPATGTTQWTLDWNADRIGNYTIKARLIDTHNQILFNSNQVAIQVSNDIPTTSGTLSGNEIWTPSSGTLHITGDVLIPENTCLTITAGTVLAFASTDDRQSGDDTARCELIVEGNLIINGTSDNPVVLTREGSFDTPGQWDGIRIQGEHNNTIIVNHVLLSNANDSIAIEKSGGTIQAEFKGLSLINGSGNGLKWNLSATNGRIDIHDVHITHHNGFGLGGTTSEGTGFIDIQRVISHHNGSHGLYFLTTKTSGNWQAKLTDISASYNQSNNADGIYLETDDHAIASYTLTCSPSAQALSCCSMVENGRNGLYVHSGDYDSALNLWVDGIHAIANARNGIYLKADYRTSLNYTVDNCQSISHTSNSGTDYGNGFYINGYAEGMVNNSIFTHNYIGFRLNDTEKPLIVTNTHVIDNLYAGLYIYQYGGEANHYLFRENHIENNAGNAFYTYVKYTNNPVIFEFIKNVIKNNQGHGIVMQRYRSSDHQTLMAFLNTIVDNTGDALNLNVSDQSIMYYNYVAQTALETNTIRLQSGAAADVRWNYWGETTTQHLNAEGHPRNMTEFHDIYDDSALGSVQYIPWLETSNVPETASLPFSRILSPACDQSVHSGIMTIRGFALPSDMLSHVNLSTDNGNTWEQAQWIDDSHRLFWEKEWEEYNPDLYSIISQAATTDGATEYTPKTCSLTIDNTAITPSGELPGDETWSGVVILNGDVIIPENKTLTIQPGTTVHIPAYQDSTGLNDNSVTEILVYGSLIAVGTENERITFMPSTSASAGAWGGIWVKGTIECQYADIHQADIALEIIPNAGEQHLILDHNTFTHYLNTGTKIIFDNTAYGSVVCTDNVWNSTSGSGLYIYYKERNSDQMPFDVTLINNTLTNNPDRGAYINIDIYSGALFKLRAQNNNFYRNNTNALYVYSTGRCAWDVRVENNLVKETYGQSATAMLFSLYNTYDIESALIIDSNTLELNQNGIDIYAHNAWLKPVISNNTVLKSSNTGIKANYYGNYVFAPELTGNACKNNTQYNIDITASESVIVHHNELSGDSPGLIALINNGSNDIDAKNNWWGVVTKESIDDIIYDQSDDSSKGVVYFDPWWDKYAPPEPPSVTPSTTNTSAEQITISGTKPENTGIRINGLAYDTMVESTNWEISYDLISGKNVINIQTANALNLVSDPVTVVIVRDTLPPELLHADPSHNAARKRVDQIVLTLLDRDGNVNDAAVINSIMIQQSDQLVEGNILENSDQFVFTPDISPLPDGIYFIDLIAVDTAGNSKGYTLTFTVDSQPPDTPMITGGSVYSGPIQSRPFENLSTIKSIELTGKRDQETSIRINDQDQIELGSDDWSVTLNLVEGQNTLKIQSVDRAGNISDSNWIDISVDTIAPVINTVSPTDNAFINARPDHLTVLFTEISSGLSLSRCSTTISTSDGITISGNWEITDSKTLTFTPLSPFIETHYQWSLKLVDSIGHSSPEQTGSFTLDMTPPVAPRLNPVITPTNNPIQTLSGNKETYAAIMMNHQTIVDHTPDINWQHTIQLSVGNNAIQINAVDRAGNVSSPSIATIVFDDTAPPAVEQLTVNGQGDGTSVRLDWTDYDESELGDLSYYRIYMGTDLFTQITGLSAIATAPAGAQVYTVYNLEKNRIYYFAVVAVDTKGNALTSVTPVPGKPLDRTPPPEISNLSVFCGNNQVTVTWTAPLDQFGDLDGYMIDMDQTPFQYLPKSQTTITLTDLSSSEVYTITIRSKDCDGNQSEGIVWPIMTVMSNPETITAIAGSGRIDLSWTPPEHSSFVKAYYIYASTYSFIITKGMIPVMTTTQPYATVTGLKNHQKYYVAVSTVNMSGCQNHRVMPVTVTPLFDVQLIDVKGNYVSPVSATDDYRLYFRFNTSMDTQINPIITLNSTGTTVPIIPDGGTWMGSVEDNDTFVTHDIQLTQGMDGIISVDVSNAKDLFGNEIEAITTAYQVTLDATPPEAPQLTIANQNCDNIQLTWNNYSSPDDLAGFRVFVETSPFNSIENKKSIAWIRASGRSYLLRNLSLSTEYYVTIVAEDRVGNKMIESEPLQLSIGRIIPPAVQIDISVGDQLSSARISWNDYETNTLCGLSGFDVYISQSSFTSIDNLQPQLQLNADARQAIIDNLDRTQTTYIAVVGINDLGQHIQSVQPFEWHDPLSGKIHQNIDLTHSTETIIPIYDDILLNDGITLTIPQGITLCFAEGTGLTVINGAIKANGLALHPVIMTSANPSPNRGDWKGVTILSSGSQLNHVILKYGEGLTIIDQGIDLSAFSAQQNTCGLTLLQNARLTLSEAFFANNHIHIQAKDTAEMTLSQSVLQTASNQYVINNSTQSLKLSQNYWGMATDQISSVIEGLCDYTPVLDKEPLLTPAVECLSGANTGKQNVTIHVACRNAAEMRISEDSQFRGSFFVPFASLSSFILSDGGGLKTIYVQLKSVSGNISNILSTNVTYITEGPEIKQFSLNEGQLITRPIQISGKAMAALGMNRMEFILDDQLVSSSDGDTFTYKWDIREMDNGSHRVRLVAWDMAGNFSKSEINVTISVYPPPAPVIISPDSGIVTQDTIDINGTAEQETLLRVSRNGFVITEQTIDSSGEFHLENVTLSEGTNDIIAICKDSVGQSANSNKVSMVLDTGPPAAPVLNTPWMAANKGIAIQWQFAEQGERPVKFNLYRNTHEFTETSESNCIQSNLTDLSAADMNVADGTYYYAVTGLDKAGNESELSNGVHFTYDKTPPEFQLTFNQPQPFGVGTVIAILTVNEKLGSSPQLVYLPANTANFKTIDCVKSDFYTYTGLIHIQEDTPSGLARVFASARDIQGNTFSGELIHVNFLIDTEGPVASIQIDGIPPIQVLEPLTVPVILELDEHPQANTTPVLTYRPPEGETIPVELIGSGKHWTGNLSLTDTMGTGDGRFYFEAIDTVGNTGTDIETGQLLEIYTTEKPLASEPPQYLHAVPAQGGQIALTFQPSDRAETYTIYRDSGTCETSPSTLIAEGLTKSEYLDIPPSDGDWCYAVTADRRGAESEHSQSISAVSDRTPPEAPANVSVLLGETGVIVSWQAPEGEAPYRYHVYRDEVLVYQSYLDLHITDRPETGGTYQYRVSSVDIMGNENESEPVSFNMTVGAVKFLNATICQGQTPMLSWENVDSQVVGFNVYRGTQQLNTEKITTNAYSDFYYTRSSVIRYQVRALKDDGQESPSRVVDIFPLAIQAVSNKDEQDEAHDLVLNGLNTIDLKIINEDSDQSIHIIQLNIRLMASGQLIYQSEKDMQLTIHPIECHDMQVVMPMTDIYATHTLIISAIQISETGSRVTYEQSFDFENVRRPDLWIDLSTNDIPIAGGYATVQACIFNQGYADMDIIVTQKDGKEPGDIRLTLKNQDGLELNQVQYNGIPGKAFVIPASKSAFIRIAPETSRCLTMTILVPENLDPGDELVFEMNLNQYYHNAGSADAIQLGSISGELHSGISQSEYYGTAQIEKVVFVNNQPIIISGQAINRLTQSVEPVVNLKVGLYSRGFEWFETVTTDEFGQYTHVFKPPKGMSGHFIAWAAHPDVYDRLKQAEFDVYRMYHSPTTGDIRMSKAETITFSISLYNPGVTPLANFDNDFRAYIVDDQTGERQLIDTLQGDVILDSNLTINGSQQKNIAMKLHADKEAPDNAAVEYIISASNGASITFTGFVSLLPAVPLISVESPSVGYVEMSIDRGFMRSVPVRIENKGLEDLLDVEIILPETVHWMQTNVAQDTSGHQMLGDIPVGASKQFDVIFSPPTGIEFGDYADKLVIKGSNSEKTFDIHLYATVTSDQTGDVQFHVINLLGQDVEKARVRMRNVAINKDLTPIKTDGDGMVTFHDIQEGEWSWQVIASGHATLAGVVKVIPNQTVFEEPMLSKSLVTINFKVEPVPFTDRYEIKLEQTFETHVPAAVLVIDPSKVDFYDVEPGFDTRFLAEARNEGLIKLHDTEVSTAETPWGRLEPMISFIPELAAQESIMIPYRLVYDGPQEEGNRKRGKAADLADCLTGGFGGMAQGLKDLHTIHSALKGRSQCYGGHGMVAAAFLLGFIHGYNAMGMVNPVDFAANAVMCAMQSMGIGWGGGDSKARITGSSSGSTGSEKHSRPSVNFSSQKPCFTENTPILMADQSTIPIQDINVGDQLYIHNGQSDYVSAVHKRNCDHIREIWYQNSDGLMRRLETTDHHLFWCDNDWKAARKLGVGDELIDPDQNVWTIVRNDRFEKSVVVYNIDLEGYRSYFANGILVHERCGR
jgi:hypothetical protein